MKQNKTAIKLNLETKLVLTVRNVQEEKKKNIKLFSVIKMQQNLAVAVKSVKKNSLRKNKTKNQLKYPFPQACRSPKL